MGQPQLTVSEIWPPRTRELGPRSSARLFRGSGKVELEGELVVQLELRQRGM